MVTLKIHGKSPAAFEIPPLILKIKAFLDKLPPDELYASNELTKAVGCSTVVKQLIYWGHPILKGYSHRIRQVRYWGNPKAIAELVRQTKNESK